MVDGEVRGVFASYLPLMFGYSQYFQGFSPVLSEISTGFIAGFTLRIRPSAFAAEMPGLLAQIQAGELSVINGRGWFAARNAV